MVIIELLFLVVFGPGKLPGIGRDFSRFVGETRRHVDEFKSDLNSTEDAGSGEPQRSDRKGTDQS